MHLPFDLHVLSTPPAFILSQDQTLLKKVNPSGSNFTSTSYAALGVSLPAKTSDPVQNKLGSFESVESIPSETHPANSSRQEFAPVLISLEIYSHYLLDVRIVL